VAYENYYMHNSKTKTYQDRFVNLLYGLTAYSLLSTSQRDIYPAWGLVLTGELLTAPFNYGYGPLFYIQGTAYLPGILPHNSLRVSSACQQQSRDYYASQISFPRGLSAETTLNLRTLNLDYAFPVCYPDFSIGPLFYVKRIRANLFSDLAWNQSFNSRDQLCTGGVDLTADFHFLRIIFPVNAGIRTIYIPVHERSLSLGGSVYTELILSVNLNGF
jgi:hypothetical protein